VCDAEAGEADRLAATDGYVAVPGGRVWYQIVGTDRPGIPILCLHGGPWHDP
jgi:hypothetical protein